MTPVVVNKLPDTDAFVVEDLDGASTHVGIVRLAPKILVDGATTLARSMTYLFASFEHQCRESRFGEIKRGNQSIVAGADDNDHQLFHSRRIFFAAFNPGAPMMPPPGCVAEPHI